MNKEFVQKLKRGPRELLEKYSDKIVCHVAEHGFSAISRLMLVRATPQQVLFGNSDLLSLTAVLRIHAPLVAHAAV